MNLSTNPVIRPLTADEADALLARNWIGRIAFAAGDRVDVEPIHYVYDPPWIFGRTSVGAKLFALAQDSWCAFETDDVRGLFDWQSVVARGPFSALNSPLATSVDYTRAVTALRRLLPAALTTEDPTPDRNVVFGIRPLEIDGRSSASRVSVLAR